MKFQHWLTIALVVLVVMFVVYKVTPLRQFVTGA